MSRPRRSASLLVPAAILAGAAASASLLLGFLALLPIALAERIWLFMLLFPLLWALTSSGLLLGRNRRGWGVAGAATVAGAALALSAGIG